MIIFHVSECEFEIHSEEWTCRELNPELLGANEVFCRWTTGPYFNLGLIPFKCFLIFIIYFKSLRCFHDEDHVSKMFLSKDECRADHVILLNYK